MWLEGSIAFTLVIYVFESYLDYRQYQNLCAEKPPVVLLSAIKEDALKKKITDKFQDSQAYGRAKAKFGAFRRFIDEILENALLLAFFGPWVWRKAEFVAEEYFSSNDVILVSLLWVGIQHYLFLPLSIPFQYYSQFVVEERFGFNKMTLKLFVSDLLKQEFLTVLIGAPLMAVTLKIIDWGGEHFYLYVFFTLLTFTLIMMYIFPTFIQPLFNEVVPLEEGELRKEIESLASNVKFPLTKLFKIDGSKRSQHSNAYMYGFGKNKRIVLFDTLISQATTKEIVAVLAHELGHWALSHTIQGLIISQCVSFALFYSYGMVKDNADMYRSFGYEFSDTAIPHAVGISLFLTTLWKPVNQVLQFLLTLNTRKNEFQADAFAVNLGHGSKLTSALVKLQIENLSNMNPDRLYSAYHYSHPPLVERLSAIEVGMKKAA